MPIRDLIRRYDTAVPRYTSYPTAPHFLPVATDAAYRQWLSEVPGDSGLSLYLHVPFCKAMCWYCGCHTRVVNQRRPLVEYAGWLCREADLFAGCLPAGPIVRNIHWGGGSPTMLPDANFLQVMRHLREAFAIAADAEISVEVDPRILDRRKAESLAEAGVNRASLGVQSFDPAVQQAVNRIQSLETVGIAVGDLRAAGIAALNFDLMYGLPHQTAESLMQTVDAALLLTPERVALFGYAHVPWMKRHQQLINAAYLPDSVARLEQYLAASERLEAAGYQRIGLDHYALRDDPMAVAARAHRLHRNFQGYTTDSAEVLLGLGASAIGALPQGYVQNAIAVPDYRRAILEGRLPVVRQRALDADDRLRREVIERLMCDLEVDAAAVATTHGCGPAAFQPEFSRLQSMRADGLVELDGYRLTVTEVGRPFVRAVASVFDRYLATQAARHSKAV